MFVYLWPDGRLWVNPQAAERAQAVARFHRKCRYNTCPKATPNHAGYKVCKHTLGSGLINCKNQESWLVVLREDAMSQLFYLSAEQLERIKPFFPRSHGIPRVDDRKVISGIIYVIKHGLQWKDAPREYGPYKTLYNRFLRWSRMGVFNNIFTELAKTAGQDGQVMIDATHLKAHRTAASLLKKGLFPAASDAQRAA